MNYNQTGQLQILVHLLATQTISTGPNFIKMCLPGRHQLVTSGRHILVFIKLDYWKGINYG